MYIDEELSTHIDNSRIKRSRKYDSTYTLTRNGAGKALTYTIIWHHLRQAGVYFLVTRRAAAKKIHMLYMNGFRREIHNPS